jgi:predicted GNAT family N-acyltransferase
LYLKFYESHGFLQISEMYLEDDIHTSIWKESS